MKVVCSQDELQDGTNGGCVACGQIQYGGVEPDAQQYKCENCGEKEVYGLEELLMMGLLEIDDEEEED